MEFEGTLKNRFRSEGEKIAGSGSGSAYTDLGYCELLITFLRLLPPRIPHRADLDQ